MDKSNVIEIYKNPCTSEEIRQNCRFIKHLDDSRRLIKLLLENYKEVAVDIKGRNVEIGGPISLLILATADGCCFFFDLYECEHLIHQGRLKDLLESLNIVKVIHDSVCFIALLQKYFNVYTQNVFDTQVAFRVIQAIENQHIPQYIEEVSLRCVSSKYGRQMEVPSEHEFRCLLSCCPDVWESRPLKSRAGEMAARNVLCLLPEVYANMIRRIPPDYQNLFIEIMRNVALHQNFEAQPEPCLKPCEVQKYPSFLKKIQQQIHEIIQQQIENFSQENNHEPVFGICPKVLKKICLKKIHCPCKTCKESILNSQASPFLSTEAYAICKPYSCTCKSASLGDTKYDRPNSPSNCIPRSPSPFMSYEIGHHLERSRSSPTSPFYDYSSQFCPQGFPPKYSKRSTSSKKQKERPTPDMLQFGTNVFDNINYPLFSSFEDIKINRRKSIDDNFLKDNEYPHDRKPKCVCRFIGSICQKCGGVRTIGI